MDGERSSMGGRISSETNIAENSPLKRFTGEEAISDNDPFWNNLLSFNLKIDDYDTKIFLWQTANALIILRYICKFLTQRMNEAEFVKVFASSASVPSSCASSSDEEPEEENQSDSDELYCNTAEKLLDTLIVILADLPVSENTMAIHVEAVKCVITMLSSQLYNETVVNTSVVFSYFISGACSKRAAILTKTLLRNYLVHNSEYHPVKKNDGGSIVLGIASSFWSMVQAATGGDSDVEEVQEYPVTLEVSSLTTDKTTFKLDYNALYERLCATVSQEPPMLLLYLLLHRNSGFRNFVLSRINLENLVVPVIKILHEGVASSSANSHHMYLSLIVMLILSEDDFFCKIIHETMIRDVDWLESDRPVREISLGGLCVMVFVRTIHKNAIRMRLLTKRHVKMVEQMRLAAEQENPEGQPMGYHDDVTALEEGIRTLLEIINSALCGNLRNNPHLIYTLLYHRSLFDSYQQHPMFQIRGRRKHCGFLCAICVAIDDTALKHSI
ncbi:hypothetical protein ANCCEY_03607 [Ancylostoma ceylanicum]|uniref:Dymeclin n=1 Tax=Ancylostoma ceylanicum TaxID=53326 RepID=A0A0D6LZ50_9BILA|nr:hypothetical protein ANCCEY_03607 [Ancylostoma ceylanicum]